MFGAKIGEAKIGESKKKTVSKSSNENITESEFCYCPLIWIFRSRGFSHKINHLHER